jgi:hypothetical protein
MQNATDRAFDDTIRFLAELFALWPLRHISVCLWDGTLWPDEAPRSATLVLKHSGALREIFEAGSGQTLADAYLRDDFDILGKRETALEFADALAGESKWKHALPLVYLLGKLPRGFSNQPSLRRTAPGDCRRWAIYQVLLARKQRQSRSVGDSCAAFTSSKA